MLLVTLAKLTPARKERRALGSILIVKVGMVNNCCLANAVTIGFLDHFASSVEVGGAVRQLSSLRSFDSISYQVPRRLRHRRGFMPAER